MCSEVHSSSYLMFCNADRFWHYSQCCGSDFICLCACRRESVCVSVHFRVCVCLLIPLRNQAARTFVVLTGLEGLAPIMQCSHYSVSMVCSARGEQKQKYLSVWLYLCFQYVGFLHIKMLK